MRLFNDQTIIDTLRKHNAYVTQNRIVVLKVLSENKSSLSVSRIRKLSPVQLDRVSIYRTLRFLHGKGLILTVPSSKGSPHYVLKEYFKVSPANRAANQAVCFICNSCGHTQMVEQMVPISFGILTGHRIRNCYIVLEGDCSNCKK